MSVFSENLTKTRKLANITRKEMAEKIGVSLGVYANYENGDREPRLNTLVKIASALKVSLDTFFDYDPEVNEQERIISELNELGFNFEVIKTAINYEGQHTTECIVFRGSAGQGIYSMFTDKDCKKDTFTFTVPFNTFIEWYKELKVRYNSSPVYQEGFKVHLRLLLQMNFDSEEGVFMYD